MNPLFRDMGVGVGLRPLHFSDFVNSKPRSVSWVEVISENYMQWEDPKLQSRPDDLLQIRTDYPVFLHGVSLSIGSAQELDFKYLARLKTLIDVVNPEIVSDHLCWTGIDGENLHDLLPVPYTEEALSLIVRKISQVQDFLGRRILIENPSTYLEFKSSEMTEWDFLAAMAKESDCGLLLDINNVYVSSVNHGYDPKKYLASIPYARVGQIHLAGHSVNEGYLVDTHDAPVCKEVWDLYAWYTKNLGLRSTMIERDGNIPSWIELEQEVLQVGRVRATARDVFKYIEPAAAVYTEIKKEDSRDVSL